MSQDDSQTIFRLKGSQFTLPVLQLLVSDMVGFKKQLATTIKKNAAFFHHTPLIIDLSQLADVADFDFLPYFEELRAQGLIPIGIQGAVASIQEQAKALHLAVFMGSITGNKAVDAKKPRTIAATPKAPVAVNAANSAKVITQPIRSGQQVYARGGDLIVLAAVSPGAEILADGNIHVYGPLRGRALAGILGDTNARIFCKALDAELLSIAGRFLLREAFVTTKDYAQIYLEADQLQIMPL